MSARCAVSRAFLLRGPSPGLLFATPAVPSTAHAARLPAFVRLGLIGLFPAVTLPSVPISMAAMDRLHDVDPPGNPRVARKRSRTSSTARARARALPARQPRRRRAAPAPTCPTAPTPPTSTRSRRSRTAAPPGTRARAPLALDRALERDRDGAAGQQGVVRARRPHRQLPVGGDALRDRLQPLLAAPTRGRTAATWSTCRATPRPASTRARSSRGGSREEQLAALPPGGRRRRASRPTRTRWLMPDFWQFPTVSMGLGPLMAIYQARFMKYLHDRGLADTERPQGLGLPGRRRDGRARVAGRDLARRRARSSTT